MAYPVIFSMLTHLPLLLGVLVLAAISHFGAVYYQAEIERDLTTRTQSALVPLQQPKIEVSALGQTVTLQGEVISEDLRQQAGREAARVNGVAEVRNLLEVAKLVDSVSCVALVDKLLARESITFDGYGAEIDPRGIVTLNQLITVISECPAQGFEVVGFADPRLPVDRYKSLATARAQAVILHMVLKGVSAARLTPRVLPPPVSPSQILIRPLAGSGQ